jgi:hypothetical protein
MIQATSCSIEFNCQGDARRDTGSQAKEETKAQTVAEAEDNGVRYRAREHPQRTVLPTQQIVGKIEATQHIETRARNADRRDCVMVHSTIVERALWRLCPARTIVKSVPAKQHPRRSLLK